MKPEPLLTRDQFREGVFERDGHKCVVCSAPAVDAHHILERRLWGNGGYYMSNGVSLCEEDHLKAESTEHSTDFLRSKGGITNVVLPAHLYRDQEYDKWGNPVLPNGTRLRGELFHDASVQKVIAPYLHVFTKYVKYPRTYHLPWSPGLTKDDRVMPDTSSFGNVVVTLKMDGENTTMYRDFIHARALAYPPHPSRDRIKALHSTIAHEIPEGWRLCGENLFAKHSIHYTGLEGYFYLFSVWNEANECLEFSEVKDWAQMLDLPIVKPIYVGKFDREAIEETFAPYAASHEGYVVRNEGRFAYGQFRQNVAKYVRANHVHTHGHWMREQVVPNELA